jgi:probable LLM family oxidoreductase
MELGLCTFVENAVDPSTGEPVDSAARMAHLLEEVELADQVGLDVFAIGEHHRADFLASAPAVILAAAAARTRRLRLTSAVSVLSSDDPVRVFQQFATLDLLSNGRAEIMAGRGSFTESFPLFGYNLADYDDLFAEKLDLLLALRDETRVVWSGRHRPPLNGEAVYPRPVQQPLPIWVAVGGTPESAMRAGRLGLGMALAIIGGVPDRFLPFAMLFREAAIGAGHLGHVPLGLNMHGYLADSSQQAAAEYYPSYAKAMNQIGRERGWAPITAADLESRASARGALVAGSPQQVIDKILALHEVFGQDRFLLQITVGPMPHAQVMRSIELFGTKVAPVVRREVERRGSKPVV